MARDLDDDVNTFAADALDFCGEGIYPRFLAFMEERGFDEAEVDRLTKEIERRAGRG